MKLKPEKNSGLNGIRTHDFYSSGAVLCQLSCQAIWELVTWCIRYLLADDEEYIANIWKIIYLNWRERYRHYWSSQLCTQLKQLWNWSLKRIQAKMGFEPITSAIPLHQYCRGRGFVINHVFVSFVSPQFKYMIFHIFIYKENFIEH